MTSFELFNKVVKGEIVVIAVEHSATQMHGPTTRYTRFLLATVAKASRKGKAERVILAGTTHSLEVARVGDVRTIKTYQDAAKRVLEALPRGKEEFETADALKAAILAAA